MSYEVTQRTIVFSGRIGTVRVDRVRYPDGEVDREVVAHVPAVGIVALDAQDRVVLVDQPRHAVGRTMTEIPAGLMDVDGETPEDTARRELAEEVGLAAEELQPLATFDNSAGWTDERTHVVLATGLTSAPRPAGFTAEAEEALMRVRRMPFAEVLAQVDDGVLTDAKTVVGILALARRRGQDP